MRTTKRLVNCLIGITCLMIVPEVMGQVGINNPDPHTSAVLDISSTDKGILIPRLTDAERELLRINGSPSNGLIVMDTTLDMLYHFTSGSWYSSSPWILGDAGTGLHGRFSYPTGILTANPTSFLSVEGKMAIGSQAFVETTGSPRNGLVVEGKVGIGTPNPSVALEVAGDTRLNGEVHADDYQLNNTSGNGMIPAGSIIIWSGSITNVPQGWALCDGTTAGVPDLTDRFVIGAGNTYAPDNTGGASNHQHTIDPPSATSTASGDHSHTTGSSGQGCTSGSCTLDNGRDAQNHGHGVSSDGNHNHTLNIGSFTSDYGDTNGTTTAIDEPLVPYYALAFIMKL